MDSYPCTRCGEPLFEGELFCPSCGKAAESAVAVATPPPGESSGAPISPRTQMGEVPVPCDSCGRELAQIELFCPRCGSPRPGSNLEPRRQKRYGGEAAWKELAERLKEVTTGRYEVERELGRGGMAAVFLAHEVALHRKVAIKVMRPSFLLDDALVDRFLREARTMASFHHPNIVTVHAVEAMDDLHFFVMQFISGQSLAQMVREFGPLPVAAVQSVMYQAAAGLSHAHRAGVIHRDVKPANIMMDAYGNALVTDFGIAKVMDLNTSATVGPMGTPLYMSPEQCSGVEVLTPASDQYALGTVAFELLTGKPPFERETSVALALAISRDPPPSIRELRPDCPPEIEAAVNRMLAKKPADRFPALSEAVAALGGEALPDDDPVRGFLAALARHDTPVLGPASLTPRRSRTSPPSFVQPSDITRRATKRKILAGLGVFVTAAVFTVLAVLAAMRSRSTPAAPADSTVAATPPVAASDSTIAPAGSTVAAEVTGRLTEARRLIDARDWAGAERELAVVLRRDPDNGEGQSLMARVQRSRPAPSPPPPPPPTSTKPAPRQTPTVVAKAVDSTAPAPAPAPPPPPAPVRVDTVRVTPPSPPPSRAPAIRRVIAQYVDAINNKSLDRVKALFPALSASREKVWHDLFRDDVKDLKAVLNITDVTERGDLADASFTIDLSFKPDRGDPFHSVIKSEATLKFEGGAWKFLTLTP